MEFLALILKMLFGELLKMWNRPDGVLRSPVPFLEDIDLEDDPDSLLLDRYKLLDAD